MDRFKLLLQETVPASLQKPLQHLRRRGQVKPLRDAQPQLQNWCRSPLGHVMLHHEQRLLQEELSCLFGYHFLQLSIDPQSRLFEGSRISHCFALGTNNVCVPRVQALSELESLPLADASVDVTLLHHVLEFSQNPQQVLKEAARITIPSGHIIIFGFNPWSLMGAARPLARVLGFGGIWQRHSLRRSRLEDWLQFLDFNVINAYQGCFNLPINQRSYLKRTNRLSSWKTQSILGLGNFYCLVARKDVCGVTPLRPKWEQDLIPSAVSLSKQSIAAAGKVARQSAANSRGSHKHTGSIKSSDTEKSIIHFKRKR
jgi:SAM-dependent methyltransferase